MFEYVHHVLLPTGQWSERYSKPHLDKAVFSHLKPSTVFTGPLLQSQAMEMFCMIDFRNVMFS